MIFPVIEVKNVRKSFKSVKAVRDISLRINKGQFVALLGPNGAGKTTLVEMIEGIQRPDSGEIFIMGKKWRGNENEIHNMIGISLQETRFIDKLRVTETLRLFAGFFELGMERVNEVIDLIGLEDKRKSYVVNLSGGQRQRLALGIALINKPSILLLDEPTTGLDPNARREVWEILLKLRQQSETSMILTTHYMEEAENLCEYIIIMHDGVILREGTLDQLIEEDTDEKVVEFTSENGLSEIFNSGELPFKIRAGENREKGFVTIANFEDDLPAFLSFLKSKNVSLKNMECRRKTLDDLFVELTGRKINE
ncbi:MAG: ABC transporter ATP-binding protein [Bacteroidales bacterium]